MSVINQVDAYAENHEEIAKLRAAQAVQGVDGAAGPYIPPEHAGEVPFLQLEDIYKIYQMGSEEVHANDGISVNIYHGEFVAIVGKSGSGKSTLMNIIGALDVPTKGAYLIQGVDSTTCFRGIISWTMSPCRFSMPDFPSRISGSVR